MTVTGDDHAKTERIPSKQNSYETDIPVFSDISDGINPNITSPTHNNDFTLISDVCRSRPLTLIMCVPVSRSHFEERTVIRDTWGSGGRNGNNGSLRLVFFIGAPMEDEDTTIQAQIQQEFDQHKDIVQGTFIDNHKNLTLKMLSVLRFTTQYCGSARFILKADDDVYVNIPLLISALTALSSTLQSPFILGHLHEGTRPLRYRWHKWYTSRKDYPGDVFPPYVNGGAAYAMTSSAAAAICHVAPGIVPIRLEDVHITGICAQAADVTVLDDGRFTGKHLDPRATDFTGQISAGLYGLGEIRHIHRRLHHA